jgi:hypothetical protein
LAFYLDRIHARVPSMSALDTSLRNRRDNQKLLLFEVSFEKKKHRQL